MLKQVESGELQPEYLREYPNLRKNKNQFLMDGQAPGKNRRYLEQKEYFKPFSYKTQMELEAIDQKYGHFNLKTL